jgi:hypothetical protein
MPDSEKEASKQIKSKELLKNSQKLVRQMQRILDDAKKPRPK